MTTKTKLAVILDSDVILNVLGLRPRKYVRSVCSVQQLLVLDIIAVIVSSMHILSLFCY